MFKIRQNNGQIRVYYGSRKVVSTTNKEVIDVIRSKHYTGSDLVFLILATYRVAPSVAPEYIKLAEKAIQMAPQIVDAVVQFLLSTPMRYSDRIKASVLARSVARAFKNIQ